MVWGRVSVHGMGNLHICVGTIKPERYMQAVKQHRLPSTALQREHYISIIACQCRQEVRDYMQVVGGAERKKKYFLSLGYLL